jgi:putative transposase
MPEYRRAFQPGGTFFFTLVTERRAQFLTDPTARRLLRTAFAHARKRLPFTVDAIVLLPDHLHTIWTLPPHDPDFSTRWSYLKRDFTKAWLVRGGPEQPTSRSRRRNRRRGVWQRRFWEHVIRDEADFIRHCDYIHYNPVRHGLVRCPHAWRYSSFHRFVRRGIYEPDWACACVPAATPAPDFSDIEATAME